MRQTFKLDHQSEPFQIKAKKSKEKMIVQLTFSTTPPASSLGLEGSLPASVAPTYAELPFYGWTSQSIVSDRADATSA